MAVTEAERQHVLAVCEKGYGKRTLLEEFRQQNRGGKGIILIDASDRNGPVVDVKLVKDGDEIMLITDEGRRSARASPRSAGRAQRAGREDHERRGRARRRARAARARVRRTRSTGRERAAARRRKRVRPSRRRPTEPAPTDGTV